MGSQDLLRVITAYLKYGKFVEDPENGLRTEIVSKLVGEKIKPADQAKLLWGLSALNLPPQELVQKSVNDLKKLSKQEIDGIDSQS